MRRRSLIFGLGGSAIAWPFLARAQQARPPLIGFLGATSPDVYATRLRAFHQGLKESGHVEDQNVKIEYRWANDRYERLAALAAELVQRPVTVITAAGIPSAFAAKAATATIPIVFEGAVDPVEVGLVSSLKRPGGNLTGVVSQNVDVGPKRLELLRELLPRATIVAVLINPANPANAEQIRHVLEPTAHALGIELHTVPASAESDFETAFATMSQLRADALVITPDVFFSGRSEQLAARALRQGLPAFYEFRPFVEAGGLVSYGSSELEFYRLVGIQTGKVLDGEMPANLPVQQATKVELLINVETAKTLGITVPESLLARADEVIE
ncbi:MAG TPA: ABC transporter substrate-binding protein [Stellaceae bacterium]|nr:ABC transporter substrate-binding protein [Stellaceae bacterium]